VSPRFPFISIPPPASHGASALLAYNAALENGTAQNGRRVKIDFSQSAHPPDRGSGRGRHQANDGTRDIGNTQAPVVLLRGLDFSSSPDMIAQGLRASAGPGKEGAKGMNRVILIRDKYSNASWGFAFVEFVDVQVCCSFSDLGVVFTIRYFIVVVSILGGSHVTPTAPLRVSHC
jgi:RNA-binding protein 5/10